jgi:hypothetical protein
MKRPKSFEAVMLVDAVPIPLAAGSKPGGSLPGNQSASRVTK